MGVFSRVCDQRIRRYGHDWFSEHAPASVVDKINAKIFQNLNVAFRLCMAHIHTKMNNISMRVSLTC